MMEFKIRKPSEEKIFNTADIVASKYLDVHQQMALSIANLQAHPHENLACTIHI
jgi:hypothetical protein